VDWGGGGEAGGVGADGDPVDATSPMSYPGSHPPALFVFFKNVIHAFCPLSIFFVLF